MVATPLGVGSRKHLLLAARAGPAPVECVGIETFDDPGIAPGGVKQYGVGLQVALLRGLDHGYHIQKGAEGLCLEGGGHRSVNQERGAVACAVVHNQRDHLEGEGLFKLLQ